MHQQVASPPSSRIMLGVPPPASRTFGGVLPIILEAFALDGEDRNAGRRDRSCRVVLRRIDVAGRPADIGAERRQRLDQHRGLDRHVQRAGDARALERLLRAILLSVGHQAGHLGLGQRDFLAAEIGERDVLDDVVGEGGLLGGGGHVIVSYGSARSTLIARPDCNSFLVMPGRVPGIHVLDPTIKTWMAGTRPAMTAYICRNDLLD